MPRKRKGVPQKVDEKKRKCLTWNMHEEYCHGNHSDSQHVAMPMEQHMVSLGETVDNIRQTESKNQSNVPIESSEYSISQSVYRDIYDASDYSLNIRSPAKDGVWSCILGKLLLKLSQTSDEKLNQNITPKLPDSDNFFLFVNKEKNSHYLVYSCHDNNNENIGSGVIHTCFNVEIDIPKLSYLDDLEYLHSLNSGKLLKIEKSTYNEENGELELNVCLYKAGVVELKYPSQPGSYSRRYYRYLQRIMEWFYGFPVFDISGSKGKSQDINVFFDYVRDYHEKETRLCDTYPQHPNLLPTLRPYQSKAVLWMLQKEHYGKEDTCEQDDVHPLWRMFQSKDNKKLYYNIYNAEIVKDKPLVVGEKPGGILADEMGLGKTVEVLACMLLHPRTDLKNEEKEDDDEFQNTEENVAEKVESNNPNFYSENTESMNQQQSRNGDTKPCDDVSNVDVELTGDALNGENDIELKNQDGHEQSVYSEDTESKNQHRSETSDTVELTGDVLNGENDIELKNQDGHEQSVCSYKKPSNIISQDDEFNDRIEVLPVAMKTIVTTTARNAMETDTSIIPVAVETDTTTSTPRSYWNRMRKDLRCQFQCICGIKQSDDDHKTPIQCSECGLWQHAECVNYQKTNKMPYYCPHCLVSMPALPSCATLIISPSSIYHQWVDEINRHIKTSTLKVLVYQGVKKHGFIQPHTLSKNDVVITTYETLRNEVNYVDLPHSSKNEGHRLRHAKRYMAIPTPLIAVEWWRICLDEAQMVESATTKAAEMALKLSAINRWCVTGTPIQKGIEDMYGLLLFLGVDPYWVRHWWHRLLYQPYVHGNFTPINEVVAKVLWRTAKKDVLDQINIPAQTQKTHWLKFSPVEDYFYQRKHQDCSKDVIRVMNKWPQDPDTKLNKLDRDVVHAMMLPLLKLRQACCHPQAVRGEFLPIRKTMMTMEELLQSLIQKIKIECEDAHRQLICALNGIAALHIIKDEHVEAVGKYRDVLRSIEEHKEQLKTDSIQRLHTVYNLHQILKQNHPNVGHTLRESKLEDEAEEIRTNYMAKTIALVSQSQEHLIPIQNKIAELKNQITGSHWWIDATEWCILNSTDPELMDKIKDAFLPKPQDDSISFKFRTVRGLQFVLTSELEKLQASHDVVLDKLNLLRCDLTKEVLNSAIDCHLRPYKGKIKHDCVFCQADELLTEYETKLFSMKTKQTEEIIIEKDGEDVQLTGHGSRTKGSWAPSELEKVLKILLGFVKQSLSSQVSLVQDGSVHMELFENMKKEFKCLRAVLVVLCDRVAAVDELEMATMRLRLRLPGEQYDPDTQPYIIEQTEFDQTKLKHVSDRIIAQSELGKKLGQLLYLKNLAKAQDGCQDGFNPEPCPICDRRLGDQWCVLCCGHCFCNDCMSILIKQYRINIKCAICREKTPLTGISYVTTSPDNHLDEEDKLISVKGSYSSKVEAIVRTLKRIEQQEQGAKSLVFSTWQVVLDVVAMALKDNDLEYRYIVNAGHRHFQSNLSDFKYDDTVNTLLLPVHCGSHGLNIVEATHVFLIEPLINPASEVQAIGRVHRIGQTKPTVVHHFLVKDTIEERIHTMLKPLHSSTSLDPTNSEMAVLSVGDLRKLFSQQVQPDENTDDVQPDENTDDVHPDESAH